jgi:hypothetical protein
MPTKRSCCLVLALALTGCAFQPGEFGAQDPDPGGAPGDVDATPPLAVDPRGPTVVCQVTATALGTIGLNVVVGARTVTFVSWSVDGSGRYVGFTLSDAAAGLRYHVQVGGVAHLIESLSYPTTASGPGPRGHDKGEGPIELIDFCAEG